MIHHDNPITDPEMRTRAAEMVKPAPVVTRKATPEELTAPRKRGRPPKPKPKPIPADPPPSADDLSPMPELFLPPELAPVVPGDPVAELREVAARLISLAMAVYDESKAKDDELERLREQLRTIKEVLK